VKTYTRGSYSKSNETEQWIRISDGCPNGCGYCYAPRDIEFYGIPEIERNLVKIMDMNILALPNEIEIIKDLGDRRVNGKVVYYELVCGIDYRRLTPEIAAALKASRFQNIRLAWDGRLAVQLKIRSAIDMLLKAGYSSWHIMIFMVCNYEISFEENMAKLDVIKIWRCTVSDCYYDNQLPPNIKPIYWTKSQIKEFRKKCRHHNQIVRFRFDPVPKYFPLGQLGLLNE
jgi:hypothetical protein